MRTPATDDRTAAIARAARTLHLPMVCHVFQLASTLDITPDTVRRWLRIGILPGRKLGRRWYLHRDVLLDAVNPAPAPAGHVTGLRPGDRTASRGTAPPLLELHHDDPSAEVGR